MFGGEFLTSFVPEVGVQERMREHGKDPLWKIKYEQCNLLYLCNLKISFLARDPAKCKKVHGDRAVVNVFDSQL